MHTLQFSTSDTRPLVIVILCQSRGDTPPRSADTFNKILDDFRSGRQNVADFRISFQNKFARIRYFAVHNDEGKYLGTVELTQDLAPAASTLWREKARSVRIGPHPLKIFLGECLLFSPGSNHGRDRRSKSHRSYQRFGSSRAWRLLRYLQRKTRSPFRFIATTNSKCLRFDKLSSRWTFRPKFLVF